MADILVCSRLPQNIILEVIDNGEIKKFTINGTMTDRDTNHANANNLQGALAVTKIDESLFNGWVAANQTDKLLTNNIIFTSASEKSAAAQKKEMKDEKTGSEGLSQDGDKRAGGKKLSKD